MYGMDIWCKALLLALVSQTCDLNGNLTVYI